MLDRIVVAVGNLALLALLVGLIAGSTSIRRLCLGLLAGIALGSALFVVGVALGAHLLHQVPLSTKEILRAFSGVGEVSAAACVISAPLWYWQVYARRGNQEDAALSGLLVAWGSLLGFTMYVSPPPPPTLPYLTWPFLAAISGVVAGLIAWRLGTK